MKLDFLVSDWLIWALVVIAIISVIFLRRMRPMREAWRQVLANKIGMVAATILFFYVVVGLMDSVHFEVKSAPGKNFLTTTKSLLDVALDGLIDFDEETYSAPFATHAYTQSIITLPNGAEQRGYAKLTYGGVHLKDTQSRLKDIVMRGSLNILIGFLSFIILLTVFMLIFSWKYNISMKIIIRKLWYGETKIAWREIIITFGLIWLYLFTLSSWIPIYHIFGTDKVGHDVFYASIKSIRTGLLIGILTTVFMLPFALILGMTAGFFGGWLDDIIQYVYTTLSSIPGVLLISATILVMQIFITLHPEVFPTLSGRADARLLALCLVLGLTGWAGLCRLLRAETLKLRELEFVDAARALGVNKVVILFRHIMPNILHIVLITVVLDFSMLVLAEAVLSYVGVGVDPTTYSWGNMINSSRLELAREPIVWWPLFSAMFFMFTLVLAANLFADAVRDALDPRIRT